MSCAGNCTADLFIGGTQPKFKFTVRPNSVRQIDSEISNLDIAASCGDNFSSANNTWVDVSAAHISICGFNFSEYSLDFTDSQDAFVIDINVTIPVDAPPTPFSGNASSAQFTFDAESSA
jgi:hypothetical protein